MAQVIRMKDRLVDSAELKAHAPTRNQYHFPLLKNVPLSKAITSKPMLKGSILTEQSDSGMVVHITNAEAMQSFIVDTQIQPCIRIILFFEGENRFCFGQQNVTFEKDCQRARIVMVTREAPCRMDIRKGDRRSGLYVSVGLDWFSQQGIESDVLNTLLAQQTLNIQPWALPRYLWLQARNLLDLPVDSQISRKQREAFGMSLMMAWLWSVEEQARMDHEGHDSRQAQRFCQLLAQEESWSMTREQLGDRLGMSHATLQRYAQEHLGMSLNQYLRKQRLVQACQALYENTVSITEAAALAGYNHSTNFSAAFKRQFGVSPAAVHHYSLNALLSKH